MTTYELYQHDCRDMHELPDESIHCVTTSPPYWSLRKYSGEQDLIWDGDDGCQHQWAADIIRRNRGSIGSTVSVSNDKKNLQGLTTNQGNFCTLCGAWKGAFGLEPTPELYIQHSVQILREIRRVLRSDGVCFYNIGDSYWGGGNNRGNKSPISAKQASNAGATGQLAEHQKNIGKHPTLKPLDLCLIPERLAIALQLDGWYVRSIIIWHKKNPMPESVNGWRWERHRIKVKKGNQTGSGKQAENRLTQGFNERWDDSSQSAQWQDCPSCPKCSPNDGYVLRKGSWRPTDAYEHILMLTKTDNYFCDAEAAREAVATSTIGRGPVDFGGAKGREYQPDKSDPNYRHGSEQWGRTYDYRESSVNGRNLRNVWNFPTVPYPGTHFAVFPEKLPELCIKAATPEVGVCAKCGKPWARLLNRKQMPRNELPKDDSRYRPNRYIENKYANELREGFECGMYVNSQTLGWKPTCNCNCSETVPATVLDPFAGAGTTLLSAIKLGRKAVGYEISERYCQMTRERLDGVKMLLIRE